jgi:hypothetical protein
MMAVEITVRDRGLPLIVDALCEGHGREEAARLGARWPQPHEHAAVTRVDRVVYIVRVTAGVASCDLCRDAADEVL